MKKFRRHIIVLSMFGAFASAAHAQTSQPTPLPGLDDFSLPSSRPTPPASPAPEPTTNPRPVAPPVQRTDPTPAARSMPAIRPTPAARPTPHAVATPTRPLPVATPAARVPVPAPPLPDPAPLPVATPEPSPVPPSPIVAPLPQASPLPAAPVPAQRAFAVEPWMWLALAVVVLAGVLAGLALRWRKRAMRDEVEPRDGRAHEIFVLGQAGPDVAPLATPSEPALSEPALSEPTPPAMPAPAVKPIVPEPRRAPAMLRSTPPPASPPAPVPASLPPAQQPAARAMLELELKPKRAGTNLLSAAVEYTIVVRNAGAAGASGIRLDIRLLGAGRQQDALLTALFTTPIGNPITTPFDVPPGATVELDGMAMHPRDTLQVLDGAGRALFVPVVAVNLLYDWDGGSGQTACAYVVGLDRGEGARLQPFRLDGAPRMHTGIAALTYTLTSVR